MKGTNTMFDRAFGADGWKMTVGGLVLSFGQYLYAQANTGFTWETFLTSCLPTLFMGILGYGKPQGVK